MSGWLAFSALFSILVSGGSAFEKPSSANCLKTVGAVEYNYNASALPDNARNLACYFNDGESCYSFVPHNYPESVEYGCGKINVDDLPLSCGEARNDAPGNVCWDKAFHHGERGKLCCCMGEMCNKPLNVESILPTTTTTTTTPAPTSDKSAEIANIQAGIIHAKSSEDDNWWQVPLLVLVIFILVLIVLVVAGLIYILSKIRSYRAEQSNLSKGIDDRLQEHSKSVAKETRNLTIQNFRSLVEQYHAARRARHQQEMQMKMNQQKKSQNSDATKTTLTTGPNSQITVLTDPTQKSSNAEAGGSTTSTSKILGFLPRNPCRSARNPDADSTKSNVSLEKLPRVEHV